MMRDFVAIDFETANPKRVSACALGFAIVQDGEIVRSMEHIIKPIGGHAPFQSKIHGLKDEHTCDQPEFNELYHEIKDIFKFPVVAHSKFDQQVLNALSDHFNLDISYSYIDSSAIAREMIPNLTNYKLKTLQGGNHAEKIICPFSRILLHLARPHRCTTG